MKKHDDNWTAPKMPGIQDETQKLEQDICKETKGRFKHILRVFLFAFQTSKGVCIIYLSLTILLALLRPFLAFIWGTYVEKASADTVPVFISLFGLLIAYFIINFFISIISRYTVPMEEIERLDVVQRNHFQENANASLYRRLASLSPEYLEVPRIQDNFKRSFDFINESWDGVSTQVMLNGYNIVAKTVSVMTIALSLYYFHPVLCLIVLIAPIPTLYTSFIQNRLQYRFLKDNAQLERESGYFLNLLLKKGIKEIKAMDLFDFFFHKWKERSDLYTRRETKKQILSGILGTISSTISSVAGVSANVLAIILMVTGQISLGVLGAVSSLVGTLVTDMSGLFTAVGAFMSKKNECGQLCSVLDLHSQAEGTYETEAVKTIEAKDLWYRYPMTDQYVLKGINLKIQQGEKIALVGENGAGKTTFVKMISGMADPSKGDLMVNGIPARQLNENSRYGNMGAVFQEPARYHTFTIDDNVFLGDPQKQRDETMIGESLEFAGFGDADRYALLGKDIGGTDLSGGQWQKLAIARCAYRNQDFMILDEPTGNLDPLAEQEVFQKYVSLAKDRTVVMVTHRISVAALADRVIVFKDGQIAEDGTHEELMERDGVYAQLYREQAKWYNR